MLSQRAQIPCKLVSAAVSVLWGFNKVLRSGMLRVSWQWDSCVVVTVCELRSPSMSDFLEGLESSGWLKHIKAVLDAGIFIAKVSLEANPHCLPHRCPQYWFRCGFVCVLYLLCVCVKPTSSRDDTRSPWGFPPDLHEWATTTDRWSGYHIYHLITMYSGPSFIMGVTF